MRKVYWLSVTFLILVKSGEDRRRREYDKMRQRNVTYTAYVKFDFDKMQPRSYRNNPDFKQAKEQIPTNENKVQVAVNEQGKTHEATKHTKDPLSPGQSAPKNEKQQKEQNAEEQKPKRKARSVKM